MKIAIIGPAYPYRGGIAQAINSFIITLVNKGHVVTLFNFCKLYPEWLYPGKNQFETSDTPDPFVHILPLKKFSILNTLSILSWWRAYRMILNSEASVCFVRYWHPFFIPCLTIISFLLRRKKIQVICIVDNLLPHERLFGDLFFVKILFSQIDKVITQSDIVHEQFIHFFPKINEKMIPLPIYDQFGPPADQISARKYLKIPVDKKNILLFFGFIRPYKGLDTLLTALPIIRESIPDVTLYIVGECFGDFSIYQNIIDNLHIENIISKHLSYIPSEDIKYWLGSCDLLVMPYKTVTNSGVNSAGTYYSKDTLLTVGLPSTELATRIIRKLVSPNNQEINRITWDNFTNSVVDFI